GGAARRPARHAHADLQMRALRDAHRAAADLGELLPGLHGVTDMREDPAGVAVVDIAPGEHPAAHLEHRSRGPEAVDALLDDGAVADRDQDCGGAASVAGIGEVDTLVLAPGA